MSRPGPPAIVELSGRLIRLRPFVHEEADVAWRGLSLQDEAAHPRRTKEDWSPTPSQRFRTRLGRSGRLWRGSLDLAVERRGRLIGLVGARTRPQQCLPAGVFEIGIVLFLPKDRGNGYGRESVELVTRWLFDVAGAERVQAGTDARNGAMRAVLEHLGFRLEGIMRSYGARSDGTRIDGAMYALVSSDVAVAGAASVGRPLSGIPPQTVKRSPSSRTTSTIRSTSSSRVRQFTMAGRNATFPA